MTSELTEESNFFRNYSGVLCQQLKFEMLDDGLIINLRQPPDNIHYKHSYSEHHFFKRAEQSNQALIKACNNKARNINTVLDLTAGWGMDSFILACHGHSVTSVEQNQLVHMIDAYSLNCARAIKRSAMAASRITLIHGEVLCGPTDVSVRIIRIHRNAVMTFRHVYHCSVRARSDSRVRAAVPRPVQLQHRSTGHLGYRGCGYGDAHSASCRA